MGQDELIDSDSSGIGLQQADSDLEVTSTGHELQSDISSSLPLDSDFSETQSVSESTFSPLNSSFSHESLGEVLSSESVVPPHDSDIQDHLQQQL